MLFVFVISIYGNIRLLHLRITEILMNTEQLSKADGVKIHNFAQNTEITGFYAGDLLSWVMGRACEGDCWFTIMSNMNVCAVAKLLNLSAVMLCEDVSPDEKLLEKARAEGINLFSTSLSVYEACVTFGKK